MDCHPERLETFARFHRRPHLPHYSSDPHLLMSVAFSCALKMVKKFMADAQRINSAAFTLKHVLTFLKLATLPQGLPFLNLITSLVPFKKERKKKSYLKLNRTALNSLKNMRALNLTKARKLLHNIKFNFSGTAIKN